MALELNDLYKSFPSARGSGEVAVLKGLNLKLERGKTLSIVGQSGSGKSTLLSVIAGLDRPEQGQVLLDGRDLNKMNQKQLSTYRAQNLGIVFQQFHLLPHLSALENVALPLELAGKAKPEAEAAAMLEAVGLSHRLTHFPSRLSGGECQRVAIARALVVAPKLLLADEPTGNLDEATGEALSDLFFKLVAEQEMTLLLVTHNRDLAGRCDRRLVLSEGALHEDLG